MWQPLLFSAADFYKYHLGGIEESRNEADFQARTDNKSVIVNAVGVFREYPLPRGKYAPTK